MTYCQADRCGAKSSFVCQSVCGRELCQDHLRIPTSYRGRLTVVQALSQQRIEGVDAEALADALSIESALLVERVSAATGLDRVLPVVREWAQAQSPHTCVDCARSGLHRLTPRIRQAREIARLDLERARSETKAYEAHVASLLVQRVPSKSRSLRCVRPDGSRLTAWKLYERIETHVGWGYEKDSSRTLTVLVGEDGKEYIRAGWAFGRTRVNTGGPLAFTSDLDEALAEMGIPNRHAWELARRQA